MVFKLHKEQEFNFPIFKGLSTFIQYKLYIFSLFLSLSLPLSLFLLPSLSINLFIRNVFKIQCMKRDVLSK